MSNKIFSAAALLAVASLASASSSSVNIVNDCSFTAYYAVSQGGSANSAPVPIAPGASHPLALNGDAICLKFSPDEDINAESQANNITQIEYSVDTSLWYDLSNINGTPFRKYGFTLTPSDSSCATLVCAPTNDLTSQCTDAYNKPDDSDTHSCPLGATTTLNLCGAGGSSGSSGSGSSAPSSSNVPVYQPSSSAVQIDDAAKNVATKAAVHTEAPHTTAAAHTTAAPAPAPAAPKVEAKVEEAPSAGQPVHVDANGNAYVEVAKPVYYTTFVTVDRREAEATAAPVAERSEHQHQHGHAHAHAGHRRM